MKYGGQTTCGHPYCRPDAQLERKLDSHEALLTALEEMASESGIRVGSTGVCLFCGERRRGHAPNCKWVRARAAIEAAKEKP